MGSDTMGSFALERANEEGVSRLSEVGDTARPGGAIREEVGIEGWPTAAIAGSPRPWFPGYIFENEDTPGKAPPECEWDRLLDGGWDVDGATETEATGTEALG